MGNLFDIDNGILELLENGFNNECVTEDGEIDQEAVFNYLDSLGFERAIKIESIALYIKDLLADAIAIKNEETKLKKRRETKEKTAERLSEYVKASMMRIGDEHFETPRCLLSFRTSKAVVITDESKLDKKYVKETVSYTVDKTAIKKALDKGEEVQGAFIEERKNLQIK